MVEIKNISKKYFGKPVVSDISMKIKKGTTFGFLGRNGSGKTTTMKMIVGITSPDEGEIFVDGKPSGSKESREKMGFMPEAPYFYDRLTGMEFLKFCRDLFEISDEKNEVDLGELLKRVGIFEARNKPIRSYSKGMRQRLGFAQAMVNDPEYVFLDEPLDGLDPIGRKEAKEIIKSLKESGRTIFFNSHILYDVEEMCDEIGIIDEGNILYKGPVENFVGEADLEERFVELINNQQPTTGNRKQNE